MKKPSFTPISNENNLFSDKKNLDLADSKHKHSYFDRNDKTFHIKFPVPNKNFEIYYITNDTEVDSVRPIITLHISDKTTDKARKKPKKHIAYIKFNYNDIIPHPGIDFDLNSVKEIIIIIFNDDKITHGKKDKSILGFKSREKADHFCTVNKSNTAEPLEFKLENAVMAEISDFKLYEARVNEGNIIELFKFKPDEVGGGCTTNFPLRSISA